MCVNCGCSDDAQGRITLLENGETIDKGDGAGNSNHNHTHTHTLADGTVITHNHEEDIDEVNASPVLLGRGTVHHSLGENSEIHAHMHGRTITLEREILGKNDRIAQQNRHWFQERGILALNLVSSPGAGKTTLLTRTINDLKSKLAINVIEGDQETINDAEKIRQTGCKVVQINTGTGCHLEAEMVRRGYLELNPPQNSLLAIENVGNLVCPALFDLGEKAKVAILSVTEGEDKPIKYPHMFRASQVAILTKIDLLPYLEFDVDRCLEYARQVNPHIQIFQVSSTTGAGLNDWYQWLLSVM